MKTVYQRGYENGAAEARARLRAFCEQSNSMIKGRYDAALDPNLLASERLSEYDRGVLAGAITANMTLIKLCEEANAPAPSNLIRL